MKNLFIIFILSTSIYSSEVISISKSIFSRNGYDFDMRGKNYIVIELTRHNGGAGNFYAIDQDGTVWLSGPVTAGLAPRYSTPSGVFGIDYKKRYHMSTKYPDERGINNMNYSMFFNGGIAMHQGSVRNKSHGCVHISREDVSSLFRWAKRGTTVIVTRDLFRPFVEKDLFLVGLDKKWKY